MKSNAEVTNFHNDFNLTLATAPGHPGIFCQALIVGMPQAAPTDVHLELSVTIAIIPRAVHHYLVDVGRIVFRFWLFKIDHATAHFRLLGPLGSIIFAKRLTGLRSNAGRRHGRAPDCDL